MGMTTAQTMLELADKEQYLFEAADIAYFKAGRSSNPQDWLEAGLLARQHRNALTAIRASQPAAQATETLYRQVITKDRIHYEAVFQAPAGTGGDGTCFYCGDPTSHLVGDPGQWPLIFCQPDGTGIDRFHHTSCVVDRLSRADLGGLSTEEITYIRTSFSYDPDTGLLTRIGRESPSAKLGPITSTDSAGYLACRVGRKKLSVHRIAWFLSHGVWPVLEIDHINGLKTDNRLINLREADKYQNKWNTALRNKNTTGFKGVTKERSGRFSATIAQYGEKIRIGTYETAEEAHGAYSAEAARRFGEYANDGFLSPPQAPDAVREALENCLGCITAAESEGLHELIVELRGSNDSVDRLIDLIDRRLLWVREYAQPALAPPDAGRRG